MARKKCHNLVLVGCQVAQGDPDLALELQKAEMSLICRQNPTVTPPAQHHVFVWFWKNTTYDSDDDDDDDNRFLELVK